MSLKAGSLAKEGRRKRIDSGEGVLLSMTASRRFNDEFDETEMGHGRQMGCQN